MLVAVGEARFAAAAERRRLEVDPLPARGATAVEKTRAAIEKVELAFQRVLEL